MPYITTQSAIRWHYQLKGESDPLLFLHGWAVNSRIFAQQVEHFSHHYQTLSLDLPGHGQSSWRSITLENMTRDIHEIITELNFKNVRVVGSSLGGLIALKMIELYPHVIRHLIIVGTLPKFAKGEDYPYGLEANRITKLSEQLVSDYPAIVDIFFRSLFTRHERESERFKWIKQFKNQNDVPQKEALMELLELLKREDLRHVVSKIDIPIDIINGDQDYICPRDSVDFYRQALPNARVKMFEKCGHFPFLVRSNEFNQTIEEFLKA